MVFTSEYRLVVSRLFWEQEIASSTLATPTNIQWGKPSGIRVIVIRSCNFMIRDGNHNRLKWNVSHATSHIIGYETTNRAVASWW